MFEALGQLWNRILLNVESTTTEGWIALAMICATWLVFAVLHIRDALKHPEKYTDSKNKDDPVTMYWRYPPW